MPARTNRCTVCNVSVAIPDADWSTVQRHEVGAWEAEHLKEAHGGDNDILFEVTPNPLYDM
jgi:hypothetical protein